MAFGNIGAPSPTPSYFLCTLFFIMRKSLRIRHVASVAVVARVFYIFFSYTFEGLLGGFSVACTLTRDYQESSRSGQRWHRSCYFG